MNGSSISLSIESAPGPAILWTTAEGSKLGWAGQFLFGLATLGLPQGYFPMWHFVA